MEVYQTTALHAKGGDTSQPRVATQERTLGQGDS